MTRSADRIRDDLISLLPPGWALGFRGGVLDAVLGAIASGIEAAEISVRTLIGEADPRAADKLLSDFERVLGPDACGRDLAALTISDRRSLVHQRWTSVGGQSRAYFINVAAKLGVTITIEEFWPSEASMLRAGQPLRPEGCQFVWRVQLPAAINVRKFRASVGTAGQPLGSFEVSNIECELRRLAPAHTLLVFAYGG